MKAADQYHVGIVVDDLDAELAQLTELFGYEWTDEVALPVAVRFRDGTRQVDFRFRYSKNEPRLEVIEARPGTVWTPVEKSRLHHLGYWSDDVAGDGATLATAGYIVEAEGVDHAGHVSWAYWGIADGPRIELVSRSVEPFMALLWGPGDGAEVGAAHLHGVPVPPQ